MTDFYMQEFIVAMIGNCGEARRKGYSLPRSEDSLRQVADRRREGKEDVELHGKGFVAVISKDKEQPIKYRTSHRAVEGA